MLTHDEMLGQHGGRAARASHYPKGITSMASYMRSDAETVTKVRAVMEQYHGGLHREGVTVGVLWAYAENDPALKTKGYPVLADIAIQSPQNRALGVEDAVIWIDAQRWKGMSEAVRVALIDHELYHLEIVRDNDGTPQRDDLGRPKLKSRPHDWEVGGFDAIVKRHGDNAPEKRELHKSLARLSQGDFAFAEAEAVTATAPLGAEMAAGMAVFADSLEEKAPAPAWRYSSEDVFLHVADVARIHSWVAVLSPVSIALTYLLTRLISGGTTR